MDRTDRRKDSGRGQMRVLAYIQGDLGVGVQLGGQKGEGSGKTEEVGSGEVVA